jgi:hypothetical protein
LEAARHDLARKRRSTACSLGLRGEMRAKNHELETRVPATGGDDRENAALPGTAAERDRPVAGLNDVAASVGQEAMPVSISSTHLVTFSGDSVT